MRRIPCRPKTKCEDRPLSFRRVERVFVIPQQKSILIIRPTAIGDIVMASPMVEVLREAYPGAHIAWLSDPGLVDLLRHHPGIDEVILWPKGKWKELARRGRFGQLAIEISRFRGELRRRRFDLALDAVGLLRSRLLAWISGAGQRIGFESKEPGRFLMTRIISRPESDWMSSEYRHMMEEIGLDPRNFRPCLGVGPEDEQAAGKILLEQGIHGKFAIIAPFTTRPQKHWFDDRWGEVARGVWRTFGLPVALLGGPVDRDHAERIVAETGTELIDLVGKTTLGETAAIVQKSDLVIGVDTGLTHMGTAFDRPTIALFGATCPYLKTANPATRVLYNAHPCSPCRRSPVCDGEFTCMKSITPEKVLAVAGDLLGSQEGQR